MKQRLAAPAQRDQLQVVRLHPELRLSLLSGMLDGDGYLHPTLFYAFDTEHATVADFVCFLARVPGLSACSRIVGPAGWCINGTGSNFDTQAQLLDNAIAKDRTVVPAGVGAAGLPAHFQGQDPYSGAMRIIAPAGAPQRRGTCDSRSRRWRGEHRCQWHGTGAFPARERRDHA
jgi:hypothetical protein